MKFKSFVAGIVAGAIMATSITVFADNSLIEAWLTDQIKVIINGEDFKMSAGNRLINYNGQIYAPLKVISEAVGGEAVFDADEQKIRIRTPQERVEFETIEVVKYVEKFPERVYEKAPVKQRIKDVVFNVYGFSNGARKTFLYVDLINENYRGLKVDLENAYIEAVGIRYKCLENENPWCKNTIVGNEELKDQVMLFEQLPDGVKEMTIVVPILLDEFTPGSGKGMEEVRYNFNMDIKFDN